MKRILTACIGVMVMVLATGPVMAADNDIVIGLPNWTSAHVTGEVLKYIGENDLGLKIGTVRSSNPVIFKAMHEGKGGIDVHPEVWMPNQANLAKKNISKRQKPSSLLKGLTKRGRVFVQRSIPSKPWASNRSLIWSIRLCRKNLTPTETGKGNSGLVHMVGLRQT